MRFEILGPVRVRADRRVPGEIAIAAGRERTLLAVLLLHANRTVLTAQLVDAVWGTRVPADGRSQLQGCVSRLRSRLTEAGLPGPVIVTDPAGYRAAVAPDDLDLLEFRRLIAEARNAAGTGRVPAAIGIYRTALALWHGPALAGVDSSPVRHAAVALDEERAQALEERIELELAAGAAGQLVAELTELVRQHPHREGLHRALMRALYRAGRQADALATYRHARQLLHDELGIEPGSDLQHLHQAILHRDPALDLPPQPAHPPPLAGTTLAPRELPAEVAGFTGRADALKTLHGLLPGAPDGSPPPVVISAIAGTAGIGKTALAVHWAHRVADQFPDGQLYVNLHGYATRPPLRPIEALSALLRSLGVRPEQVPTQEEQAAALYRTRLAGRRALILLDNARAVDQVRPLLPGGPGCFALVTSRDRLTGLVARDGATRVTLDVLTPDEAHTLLTRLLSHERVRAEPEAATQLATACAHLPLALRIAAAHLIDHPDQSITAYVSALIASDRLAALQTDGDEETAVRAALDLSYGQITSRAQQMFRLLGLVPGLDFTPAAAAALTGIPHQEAVTHLRDLATAHLLTEHSPGRYTFHDLLRLYALRLTEEAERADQRSAAVERLLHAYLRTAEAATDLLSPPTLRLPTPPREARAPLAELVGVSTALAWLDSERANLVAAIEYAADHGPLPLVGPLNECMRHYGWQRRCTVEWMAAATAAMRAADRAGDRHTMTVAHLSLAGVHYQLARYPEAIDHYRNAIDLGQQLDWTAAQGVAHGGLAMVHRDLGQLRPAADHFARSGELFGRNGMLGAEVSNLSNLAGVNRDLGRLRQAHDELARALELSIKLGSAVFEAAILNNLGAVDHELGQLDTAAASLTRTLALHEQTGDRNGTSIALDTLAAIHRDAGRLTDALDQARAGVAITVGVGNPTDEAFALNTLGTVQLRLGDPGRAVVHHQRALDLASRTGAHQPRIEALIGLADCQQHLSRPDNAVRNAQHAFELARAVGFRAVEGRALTSLGEALLSHGDHHPATEHALQALDCHRETGHRLGEARTLALLGRIRHATGQPAAASRHWREALELFAEIGAPPPEDLGAALGDVPAT